MDPRNHPSKDETAQVQGPDSRATPVPEFAGIVVALQAQVWRLCRHLADPQSADDLTQEVFARVYQALPGFRHESSVRTWVLAITRRVCADHVRQQARNRKLHQTVHDTHPDPHAEVYDPTGELDLWDAVNTLELERRTAFVLTQVFGLSYQETAQVCGCPIGTIRSRVARARDDLINIIDQDQHGLRTRHH